MNTRYFILSAPAIIFAQNIAVKMPQKIKPTGRQKSMFYLHAVIYAIGVIIMVMIHHKQGEHHWAYPWHAWIIAAWGLALIGHGCAVFLSYEDKGHEDYRRQEQNG